MNLGLTLALRGFGISLNHNEVEIGWDRGPLLMIDVEHWFYLRLETCSPGPFMSKPWRDGYREFWWWRFNWLHGGPKAHREWRRKQAKRAAAD